MVRAFLLCLILLFTACTHTKTPSEVKTFVRSMQDQYEPHDPYYAQTYERYLTSVENVYRKNGQEKKFRSYLDSLNNNSQILEQQQAALPALYRNETGRKIASHDKNYELFKTREMTSLHDKIFTARELKIKDEVGDKTYENLQENYVKFIGKTDAEKYGFPL